MSRVSDSKNRPISTFRALCTSASIGAVCFAALYANFNPEAVGDAEDINDALRMHASTSTPISSFGQIASLPGTKVPMVPLPADLENIGNDESAVDAETGRPELPTDTNFLSGKFALQMSILLLEKGEQFLKDTHSYSTIFTKRERIDGEISDPQMMKMKIRTAPFSVYMKWMTGDKGRQVLYVEGENDNRLTVKLGGLKGRFLPALNLDPYGSRAMAESRHPITKAGILQITQKILKNRREDSFRSDSMRFSYRDDLEFEGRPCHEFQAEYTDPEASETYRKSTVLIDSELSIPVNITNFTWAESDDVPEIDTLVEEYSFTDLQFGERLAAIEFDRKNSKYRMR